MAELGPSAPSCIDNQGPVILAVSWFLLAVAIITVILRLHIRFGLYDGLKADDYTIVASVIVAIIGTSCLTKLVYAGLGRHIWCLPHESVHSSLKWSIIAQIFNVIGIGLAKISVTLCVLRIIDRTRTHLAIFLYSVIALVGASHLSQVILFLVQCRPMAAIWNPHLHGECFSPHITYLAGYIGFGLDAFTDVICAGIPIFVLHRLQINQRTKLALCCLMGLGSLTAGCAIAKAILLEKVFEKDYTWAITKPAFCTIIEHMASIILVSLPALKPLFNKVLEASSRLTHTGTSKRSSRANTPRSSRYLHPRAGPIAAAYHHHHSRGASYPADKLSRSDADTDTERGDIPLCARILKTTDFRVSSHNSIVSHGGSGGGQRGGLREDEWPLAKGSVGGGRAGVESGSGSGETDREREMEGRRLGNSWRMG